MEAKRGMWVAALIGMAAFSILARVLSKRI
jgi:hypothetical protein